MLDLYVGCFTSDIWRYYPRPGSDVTPTSSGIEHLRFDEKAKQLRHVGCLGGDLRSPQHLSVHPSLPVFYACEFSDPARLISFTLGDGGIPSRQFATASLGAMADGVSVEPQGRYAFVAHLSGGALTAIPLGGDGAPLGAALVAGERSAGVRPLDEDEVFAYRGEASKLHQVRVAPGGRHVLVTDVGRDELVAYALDGTGRPEGPPTARVPFPAGSSPRTLEFHPSGRICYVVGEGDGLLHVVATEEHVPQRILHSVTIAAPGRQSLPAELVLHPGGRALSIAVRRSDTICTLTLDMDGLVTAVHHAPSLGADPRGLAVDPTGRFLAVANWSGHNVVMMELDALGRPTHCGDPVQVPSPSSILLRPAA